MKERETIIAVERLTGGYGRTAVLRDVSFAVEAGEIVALLGGSGCGKSTLMNMMIGLLTPWQGRIAFQGQDLVTARRQERAQILRRIGVAFQGGALFGSMTVLDNVTLALEMFTPLPRDLIQSIGRAKLRLVDLAGSENHLPSELSGGMQKRAAVARALALDPDILFLDEPSAGLDPVTAANLDDLILQVRDNLGTTVVIVTHELPSIMAIADRVIMLDKSVQGIIAQGRPQDLANDRSQAQAWQFFNRVSQFHEME